MKDSDLGGEKFGVLWGLPIYSSDTISSVAYAGEEVLMVLLPVMGLLAAHTLVCVMCAIIALLLIVLGLTIVVNALKSYAKSESGSEKAKA